MCSSVLLTSPPPLLALEASLSARPTLFRILTRDYLGFKLGSIERMKLTEEMCLLHKGRMTSGKRKEKGDLDSVLVNFYVEGIMSKIMAVFFANFTLL